jgi:hypothetical protein
LSCAWLFDAGLAASVYELDQIFRYLDLQALRVLHLGDGEAVAFLELELIDLLCFNVMGLFCGILMLGGLDLDASWR